MIKAGIHTYSWRTWLRDKKQFSLQQAIERSAEMGFESIEIMAGKAGENPPGDLPSDHVRDLLKIKEFAEKHGLRLHCYATYNDFAFTPNEEWRLANITYIKHWLQLAGETGVENIRMLTGYYQDGEDRRELEELTLRGIEECLPVAERYGVNMAIENHNSIFFRGKEIVELIRHFDSPRLTTCPDLSNGYAIFDPECPESEYEAMWDNFREMLPYATDCHVKIKSNGSAEPAYDWDWERIVRTCLEYGYHGPIHFEAIGEEDLIAPLPAACQRLRRAISALTTTIEKKGS